jgi:hypothetical protein
MPLVKGFDEVSDVAEEEEEEEEMLATDVVAAGEENRDDVSMTMAGKREAAGSDSERLNFTFDHCKIVDVRD